MNQDNGTIYIATNLVNGKQYIGQTTQILRERIRKHKKSTFCCAFNNAIKKYDIENFKWISFSCPEENLDWTESFLIKEFNTLAPNGYNLETGGHKHKHHNEISKQKMSGENNHNFGKPLTKETKIKLSKALKSNKNPMFGKLGEKNHMFGTHLSKETKEKISIIIKNKYKGKNNPMFGKSLYSIWFKKYGGKIANNKLQEWKTKISNKKKQIHQNYEQIN
jgi:group I intron endonuclease